MRGMRYFDSVLTCFGWGGSHMGRFRPLRMTIGVGGMVVECVCAFFFLMK